MEQIIHSFLLLLVLAVAGVQSYGTGAPPSACVTMFPGHHVNAQTSTPSYNISVSSTSYTPGQEVTVIVTSANTAFSGVLIQARSASNCSKQVGRFRLDASEAALQLITCTQTEDSITHKDTNAKTTKTFYWVAPASGAGPVYFRATVAQSKTVFWTTVKSGVVQDASQTAGNPATTVTCQPPSTVAGAGSSSGTTEADHDGHTSSRSASLVQTSYFLMTSLAVAVLVHIL